MTPENASQAEQMLDYRRILQPALDVAGGTHTYEDVMAAVEAGTMQFWPGPRSALVTQIEVTPQKTLLHFFLAGGTLPEIEAMLPPILAWGRSRGCQGATLCGRSGWQRSFLSALGWTPHGVVMGVDFSEEATNG